MVRTPFLLADLNNCVVVVRSVACCGEDRKVMNSWTLATNVTFSWKVYVARFGNFDSRSTV
jgi:hypothetical protein